MDFQSRESQVALKPLKIMCCYCEGFPVTHNEPHLVRLLRPLPHRSLLSLLFKAAATPVSLTTALTSWKLMSPSSVSHNFSQSGS